MERRLSQRNSESPETWTGRDIAKDNVMLSKVGYATARAVSSSDFFTDDPKRRGSFIVAMPGRTLDEASDFCVFLRHSLRRQFPGVDLTFELTSQVHGEPEQPRPIALELQKA